MAQVKRAVKDLTIVVNVSILNHVRCKGKPTRYSLTSTQGGEVSNNGVDTAHSVTRVVLVAR